MPVKIVALGGSLARPSTSLAAVKVALEGAADAGAEAELFDVHSLDLPMYVPDSGAVPDSAKSLCNAVHACHGMEGQVLDEGVGKQLRALGREVVRAAERFAAGRPASSETLNGQDQKRVQGAGSS